MMIRLLRICVLCPLIKTLFQSRSNAKPRSICISSSWKVKSNQDKGTFLKKDFPQKKRGSSKLALQPELEDILDTMSNEGDCL